MTEPFDPYVEWLGLRPTNRPLSYYQLFALDDFEDDTQRITMAADAALARVRSVRPGSQRKRWQQLLDELLLAKLCLMDPSRKLQLDRQLRAPASAAAPPTPVASTNNIVVEPPRINPDLFPPGMGSPPPASAPPPSAGPARSGSVETGPLSSPPFNSPPAGGPSLGAPPLFGSPPGVANPASFTAAAPPTFSMPPSSSAFPPASPTAIEGAMPPSFAPPPAAPAFPPTTSFPPGGSMPPVGTSMPPVATAPSAAPNQPSGWAGWQIPASTPASSAPPSGPPAGLSAGSPLVAPRFPSAAPASPAPAGAVPRAASISSPIAEARSAPSLDPLNQAQPAARAAAPEQRPANRPVSAPIAIGPRVEPVSSTRPAPPRNYVNFGIGAGVLAVIAMAAFILKPPSDPEDDTKPPPAVAVKPKPAPVEPNAFAPTEREPSDDSDSSDPSPDDAPTVKPVRPQPVKPQPAKPKPRPAPKPAPDPSKTQVAQAPTETDAPAAKPANPEKTASLRKALAEARGALGAREVDEAKKKLGSAKQFAQSGDDDTEIARMGVLATYVAGFWTGVRESMKGLQVTDEVNYNGTVAAVVDSDANGITLHVPGKNLEFTVKNMPASLAMMLAQRWFDKGAANKLCLGAFQAVDPQGSKADARMYWEQAASGGAPAADLMPLLEGEAAEFSSTPAGDVTAPPSDKQQAQALKQVKLAFQTDYKAAKTPDLKLELGRKLLDVANETDNPTERYALMRESLDLAAAGGSAQLVVEVADQLASAFKVDGLELKAEALVRAAGAANNPLASKEVARAALGLLDEAIRDKRSKPAGKLGQAATSAARKSKDAELIKEANTASQKSQELGK